MTRAVTGVRAPVAASVALALGVALLLGGCVPDDSGASGAGAPTATAATDAATGVGPDGNAVPESAPPTPGAAPGNAAGTPDVPRSDAALGSVDTAPTVPPARVEVPELGIDVSVVAEGLDDAGALALPADPAVASWYRWGPSPWGAGGAEGATVIASHVDSLEYGLGQFARLAAAPAGATVSVTADDGRVAAFAVQTVEVLDKTAIDWNRVFDRSGPPRLVLITCGGDFDYDTGHYLSNVVVTAVPIA